MALKTAESSVTPNFRVWVLPPRAYAHALIDSLKGYPSAVAEFKDDPCPHPDSAQADQSLRRWIRRHIAPGSWIHPGTHPWADRPDFEGICQQCGVTAVSSSPKVLSLFQNQLSLLSLAQKLGIPHLAVDLEPIQSFRELETFVSEKAQRLPFILKTIRPSNRQRLCLIQSRHELKSSFVAWSEQLQAFSRGGIFFAESYIEGSRFITVPVARTLSGKTICLDPIDGSLMSRNRKLIEIAPAWTLEPAATELLKELSQKLVDACDLKGIAFLDFLVEGDRCYLLGGVARLGSAFPLVPEVIRMQLDIWQGKESVAPHPGEKPFRMLTHLYAEDERLHLPRPGRVRALNKKRSWRHLGGEAQLLLSVDLGESVPYEGDGHLGFLSLQAKDRENAFSFANLILSDFWMAGSLQVNDAFTAQVLQHAWVKEGLFHAGFIDEDFIPFLDPSEEIQRISVSLCQQLDPRPEEKGAWLYGERMIFPSSLKWNWKTGPYRFPGGFAGTIQWAGQKKVPVMVSPVGTIDRWLVRLGPYSRIVRRTREKRKGRMVLYAQVSGRVHSIRFQEGVLLPAHEPVVVVESLQNLVPHSLPIPMRVKKWFVRAEDQVVLGQELAELESGL